MTRGTIQRDKVYVYGTCERCQEANALVYECGEQLLCAEHSRQYARSHPLKPYCDRCMKQDKVFRDPSWHQMAVFSQKIGGEGRAIFSPAREKGICFTRNILIAKLRR